MKRPKMGFKQAFEYLLDLLAYAYYVKSDNLVSDYTYDELEKFYCTLFQCSTAPKRGCERQDQYSYGVQFIYDELKKIRQEHSKMLVDQRGE